MSKRQKDRIGEINYNKLNNKMEIIKYVSYNEVYIYFEKYDYIKKVTYRQFKNKEVVCPYEPRTYGKGYLGEGKYKTRNINGKPTKCYDRWKKILQRCYDPKFHEKKPTYKDCTVCEEWLNFQNFAEWYHKHYYEVPGERMHLDKDILNKGNKIYSPENCIFVPQRINDLFVKRQNDRGDSPIGVYFIKGENKYRAQCNRFYKSRYIGDFNNEMEAFECYKIIKENYIKNVIDSYEGIIPNKYYHKLKEAIYNYKVEIDD